MDTTPNYGFQIPSSDGSDLMAADLWRVPVTQIDTNNKSLADRVAALESGAAATPWTSFTVVITAPGAFSLGNAVTWAKYKDIGKTRHIFVEIQRGSTTNVGTGEYTFTFNGLPGAQAKAGVIGTGMFYDATPTTEYPCLARGLGSNAFVLVQPNGNRVSNNSPVVPSTSDAYVMAITYERT